MSAFAWWTTLDQAGFATVRYLLTVLWQSSFLFVAVMGLSWWLRHRRPAIRRRIWFVALLAAPILPLLTAGAKRIGAPQAPLSVLPAYETYVPDDESASRTPESRMVAAPSPAVPSDPVAAVSGETRPTPDAQHRDSQSAIAEVPALFKEIPRSAQAGADKPAIPPASGERQSAIRSLLGFPWALALLAYTTGLAAFLSLIVIGRLRIRQWLRAAIPSVDERTLSAFRRARVILGYRREYLLLESDGLPAPISLGTVRRRILLPKDLAGCLTGDELLAVALHETAHHKRRDPFAHTAAAFVRAVFFFHPLVWLAARQVSTLAEMCADDAVLDATGEALPYAKLLARLAEDLTCRSLSPEMAAGLLLGKSAFLLRVEAILSDRRGQIRRPTLLALAGTVLAILLAVVLGVLLPLGDKEPAGRKPGRVVRSRTGADSRDALRPAKRDGTHAVPTENLEAVRAEYATTQTPVWGAAIEPVKPGFHRYWFYVDEKPIADPLSPPAAPGEVASVFAWPPPTGETSPTVPRVLSSNRALFVYEGEIERSAQFIAPFRSAWWGIDEFQPLNDAARANLERIRRNPSLGVVQGVVIDPDGRPIPNARARLVDQQKEYSQQGGPSHLRTVACRDDGVFLMDRLPRVTLAGLLGRAAGYAESRMKHAGVADRASAPRYEIVLTPTGLLDGIVTDEGGRPIGGATVKARAMQEPYQRTETWSEPASGRFSFGSLAPSVYVVSAEKAGYAPGVQSDIRVGAGPEGPIQTEVHLVLTQGVSLRGRVVRRRKPDGREVGVEGAEIVFRGSIRYASGGWAGSISPEIKTISDAGGGFVVEGLAFNAKYSATARYGFLEAKERPSIMIRPGDAPTSIVFHLPSESQLAGRVIDTDKNPVPGARVHIVNVKSTGGYDLDWVKNARPTEAATDRTGRFVIEHLEPRMQCSVRVEAQGFAPRQVEGLVVDSLEPVEIVLTRGTTLNGRVVVADTKEPLGNFRVELRRTTRPIRGATTRETVSAGDGTFSFANITPGACFLTGKGKVNGRTYFARARSGGSVPPDLARMGGLVVRKGQDEIRVLLEAEPAATVRGTVLTQGARQPVPEASVMARIQPLIIVQADREGRFVFTEFPPGEATLVASRQLYFRADRPNPPKTIDVKPGEEVDRVELLVIAGGTVSGIVLKPDGSPAPDIRLYVGDADTLSNVFRSDADGRFQFSAVPISEGVSHRVRVYSDPTCPWFGESEPFEVTPEKPHAEVTVQLEEGGAIVGSVTNPKGNPEGLHPLWLHRPGANEAHFMRARSDADGRYAFRGLPPNEYRVYTWGLNKYKNPKDQTVEVEAGETKEVNIVLEEKDEEEPVRYVVRGMLVDLQGRPVAGWSVKAQPEKPGWGPEVKTGHDGSFFFPRLSEEVYALELEESTPDGRTAGRGAQFRIAGIEAIQEDAAEAEAVPIYIVPIGATVQGRVVSEESGEAVSDVTVGFGAPRNWKPSAAASGVCVPTRLTERRIELGTDDGGRFRIDRVVPGRYRLVVFSSRIVPKEVDPFQVAAEGVTDLGDIPVAISDKIRLQLVDARTGEPYRAQPGKSRGGIHTFGRRSNGERPMFEDVPWIRPDAQGVVTISPVPDDLTSLTIWCEGYLPRTFFPIQLDPGGETDLGTIPLDRGYTIKGRFIDGATGKPCQGRLLAHVSGAGGSGQNIYYLCLNDVVGSRRETDVTGGFAVRCVPNDIGRLAFQFSGEGIAYLPHTIEPVPLSPSGVTDLGDVVLDPGRSVRGRITGPRGERVMNAMIAIKAGEGAQAVYRHTETNPLGEFTLGGLLAGPATISATACKRGDQNAWIEGDKVRVDLKEFPIVILPEGETNVEIRFPAATPGSRQPSYVAQE